MLIFDVDGTLLDSMSVWEDIGERYLEMSEYHSGEKLRAVLHTRVWSREPRMKENISWISPFHRL